LNCHPNLRRFHAMNESDLRISRRVSLVLSIIMLAIDLSLLGLIAWQTLDTRERFIEIFTNMGAKIPVLTSILLSVPGKVYLVVATSLAIFLVVKEYTITNLSIKLGINMVAGIVLLLFAALFHLSLLMPWMTMMQVPKLN
jgi:hypothetical protein